MPIANSIVAALLRSPLHRLLSKSTVLVRYNGRRTGHTITTPTQYALAGPDVVILVGRPDTKTWWRNFRTDRDIDVLLRAEWTPMTAQAFVGTDEPEKVSPLLDTYLDRFPKAARTLGEGQRADQIRRAVIVRCRPR